MGLLAKSPSQQGGFGELRNSLYRGLRTLIISLETNQQAKKPNVWEGLACLDQEKCYGMGTVFFPHQVLAGSFKYSVDSLNFCTALASWELFELRHFDRPILWHFLLCWVCQAGTCTSGAPSTVLPQSNPWEPAWVAAMLANLAAFSTKLLCRADV